MKLIIDIPEQMYLNAKADTLCGADILVRAIKNGIRHETVTEFADRCRECGREKVINKIRAEIEHLHYHPKLDYIKNDEVVEMALDIIDRHRESGVRNEKG